MQFEKQLRETELPYRLIAEYTRDLVAVFDREGRYIFASPSHATVLGYEPNEIVGRPVFEFVHPDDIDRAMEQWTRVFVASEGTMELRFRHADGSWRWLDSRGSIIDQAGTYYAFGISYDITIRKQTDEALQASESLFRATFEQAAVGMAHVSLDGTLLRINQRLCDIVGYTAEELCKRKWDTGTHPDGLDREITAAERALAGETNMFTMEKRLARKDRSYVWVNSTVSVVRGRHGNPEYFLAVVEDISARREAEERLRASRDELAIILAEIDDAICTLDRSGRFIYANAAFARVCGYSSVDALLSVPTKEILQKFSIVDEGGSPLAIDQLPASMALQGHESKRTVRAHIVETGEERWATLAAKPLLAETGDVQLVINIVHDITERKRADEGRVEMEALRKLDRLKSEFIANVSHELRTPLHHIKGYASTLLRPIVDFDEQTTREYLHVIVDESDKLARLIDDLLSTSQIEAGQLSLDIESLDLTALVQKAVQRWRIVGSRQFEVVAPVEVPPVAGDGHRIEQVLDNLLGNVVKHTPHPAAATVSIDVTVREVIVSVSDQGPGIDAEHIPFLFNRFYRGGTQPGQRGAGLGLHIAKALVEQHGGRIWLEVAPSGGAIFRFSLPRRRLPQRKPPEPTSRQGVE